MLFYQILNSKIIVDNEKLYLNLQINHWHLDAFLLY